MSNNFNHPDTISPSYYVAKYQGRAVAIKRNESYEATITLLQKLIPKLRSVNTQDIFISTTLPGYGDTLVQIGEDMWPELVGQVKDVEITMEDPDDVGDANSRQSSATNSSVNNGVQEQISIRSPTTIMAGSPEPISITILTTSQGFFTFDDLRLSTTIGEIKNRVETEHHIPAILQDLELLGGSLQDPMTLAQCGVADKFTLGLFLNTRQTVICFHTKTPNREPPIGGITLEIQPSLSWELATLHPSVKIPSECCAQSMVWNIDVAAYRQREHGCWKVAVPRILWDGISARSPVVGPLGLPHDLDRTSAEIDPHSSMTMIRPDNSVAVPVDQMHSYIKLVCDRRFGSGYSTPEFLK
ncbi:hypothetical protein FRC12_006197 [Ceratobasidium sp. 428]|nr:hypothetical protein FRC12_006197 [Ceratobasidium sp. 428]